jgi:hypothetical protein
MLVDCSHVGAARLQSTYAPVRLQSTYTPVRLQSTYTRSHRCSVMINTLPLQGGLSL